MFNIWSNFTIIQGLGSCSSYFIYFGNVKGYNKGIHYFSVRKCNAACYKGIGVTRVCSKELIQGKNCDYWDTNGEKIYYHDKWQNKMIMTVKLDCDKRKVTFYQDNVFVDTKDITPKVKYYFAICICANVTHYQSVPTRVNLLQ